MQLETWAMRYNVSHQALAALRQEVLGLDQQPSSVSLQGMSETAVQSRVRLEAASKGIRMWRNNVGALLDARGVPVRYGLANETKQINEVLKSADLIGIRPVVIRPEHVGQVIGQFVSREIKAAGWTYTGTKHEEAQQNWALLINSLGGDARFATQEGTL